MSAENASDPCSLQNIQISNTAEFIGGKRYRCLLTMNMNPGF